MRDKEIEKLIQEELERQQNTLELIASENIVSTDVLQAMGSVLTNKYAEGKPPIEEEWGNLMYGDGVYKSLRYYNGCHVIDCIEGLACKRFKKLFNTDYHVNVQPHSGAQANMAVFEALLNYGDTVLSMDLSNGGHLSHGSPVNYSGKHFNVIQYGINENGEIDYNEVEKLAVEHKPRLIICGASNYSKIINFNRFAGIKEIIKYYNKECYLLADIAHIAGLVAGGVHSSPFGYADIVTATTHKSLRGPRGGVIACREELAKKIDSAVFPGIQGGPLEHVIAGKAVCFYEAMQPEFKFYTRQIVINAKAMCKALMDNGFNIVGGMTENHLMTVDLRNKGITGKEAANLLDSCGITVNKNTVPNDPESPFTTSGIRIGTPAITSRGILSDEATTIGKLIAQIIDNRDNEVLLKSYKNMIKSICKAHPIY